jgi:hypothetical protein
MSIRWLRSLSGRQRAWSRWPVLGAVAAIAPLAVSVREAPRDSILARFTLAAGVGTYADVERSCSGDVLGVTRRRLREMGGAVDMGLPLGFHLGTRASHLSGVTSDDGPPAEGTVWNPYASFERGFIGLGVGYVARTKGLSDGNDFELPPVSAHLRVGSPDQSYVSSSLGENLPLYTGGGMLDIGLGFCPHRNLDLWLGGAGGEPYDKFGVLLKAQYRPDRHFAVDIHGRLGSSEGAREDAIGVGVSYTISARPEHRDGSPEDLRGRTREGAQGGGP